MMTEEKEDRRPEMECEVAISENLFLFLPYKDATPSMFSLRIIDFGTGSTKPVQEPAKTQRANYVPLLIAHP